MLLQNLTWPEVKNLAVDRMIVILPTGSFEQHGPHMPFTVDTDLVTGVALGVEAKLKDNVLLLPTLSPGMSTHHNAFPGTLDIPQPVYMQLIKAMAHSIARFGGKKVFFLNGHGGNDIPIRAVMREIKTELPDLRCVFASYWQLGAKAIKDVRESELGGLNHACEMETSIMLHLHPDRVKMNLAKRDGPTHQDIYRKSDMQLSRPVYFVNEFDEVTATGTIGHPDLATAEKGKRFLDGIVAQVVEFVQHYLTWEAEVSKLNK
jgi:creatinine amidohydrolase